MRWRQKIIWRHGHPAARAHLRVAGARQLDDIMLFSQNIPTDIALEVDIRTFRVRWPQGRTPHRVTEPSKQFQYVVRDQAAISAEIEPNSCAGPWVTRGRPLSPAAPFPWPSDSRGAPPSWDFSLARPGWVPLALSRPGVGPSGGKHVLPGGAARFVPGEMSP
jgi:hypothetical protein